MPLINGIVQADIFQGIPGLVHGVSTKTFGNMSFDRSQQGLAPQNLENFASATGINMETDSLAILNVNNTDNVILLATPLEKGRTIIYKDSPAVVRIHPQQEKPCLDAAICQQKNAFLAILPADCPPIMLFDPATQTFAIIHASTVSISKKIIFKTLLCLQKWLGVKLKDVRCYIGPGICSHCYKYKLDLASIAAQELIYFGINEKNIETSNLCTYHHLDLFFSNHRAQNKDAEGRQIAVIGLKG